MKICALCIILINDFSNHLMFLIVTQVPKKNFIPSPKTLGIKIHLLLLYHLSKPAITAFQVLYKNQTSKNEKKGLDNALVC